MAIKGFVRSLNNGDFPFLQRKDMFSRAYNKAGRLLILAKSLHSPPSWIQIETTTKCNLRCTTCLRTKTCPDLSYDMSMDLFKLAIEQSVSSRFVKPVIKLIGLGEPLLNPNIASMVQYAKRKKLTVELVSNFTLVDPETLKKLVEAQLDYLGISLDAASRQVFERIRAGAKFADVINNVKLLLKIRKYMNSVKPKVLFRTTICEDNVGEMQAIVELARSIPVDSVVFSKQIISRGGNDVNPRVASAESEESRGKTSNWINKKAPAICPAMRRCYITYDGKVMPCNFLMEKIPRVKYKQFEFGDITRNSVRSVWFSKKYKRFRVGKALGFHPYFCQSCTSIS